jgi:V/A-type H+-transporting ATPase subunit B
MNACIRLYALCIESREKRDMGFEMSKWDNRLLEYGDLFEEQITDLRVNIPLFEALDRCWNILAQCFEPAETAIRRSIIEKHWPKDLKKEAAEPQDAKVNGGEEED